MHDSLAETAVVFLLGMCAVPLAVMIEYLPDPETMAKGFVMSLITGTGVTLVKWGWEWLREKWENHKP